MIRIAKGDRAYCERFIRASRTACARTTAAWRTASPRSSGTCATTATAPCGRIPKSLTAGCPTRSRFRWREIERITADCDPAFLAAMERAAENIRAFHARQKQQSRIDPERNGVLMGQRVRGPAPRRRLCAGRHGGVSVLRADERDPRRRSPRSARSSWSRRRGAPASRTRTFWPRRRSRASTACS